MIMQIICQKLLECKTFLRVMKTVFWTDIKHPEKIEYSLKFGRKK